MKVLRGTGKEFFTVKQAADIIGISLATIYNRIQRAQEEDAEFKLYELGGVYRLTQDGIDRLSIPQEVKR